MGRMTEYGMNWEGEGEGTKIVRCTGTRIGENVTLDARYQTSDA